MPASDYPWDTVVFGDGVFTIPMKERKEMADPIPSQPTRGFGPVENNDDTRQAQHSMSNDAPTDVNLNAVVGRSQALTVDALGKGFAAAQERRQIIADHVMIPKQ